MKFLNYIFLLLISLGVSLENGKAEIFILEKGQFETFKAANFDESEETEWLGLLHLGEHEAYQIDYSNQKRFGNSVLNSSENLCFHFSSDFIISISPSKSLTQKSQISQPQGRFASWEITENKGAFTENADLAKTWNQLDEAGVGEKLRKNPDILERARSFDCN